MSTKEFYLKYYSYSSLLQFVFVVCDCYNLFYIFYITGIGVDDMFVMLATWRKTNCRLSVEERMGKAFSEAALSITITSLTDAISIGIGTITKFRSVRIFCTYTATAVLFDYFYQITFFAACMVITGHREASNRHPVTCRKAVPKSKAGKYNSI